MSTFPKMKLTYFDIDGGRAEPVRIALHLHGIPFEDHRISFETFGATKSTFPFGCVPVMEVDGQTLTQSDAMNRFVGKLTDLYPSDPWLAARCDEAMGAVEDIVERVVATFPIQDTDAKRAARLKLVEGPIPVFLRGLANLLQTGGGEYFVGGKRSMADFKVGVWIRSLLAGVLDHVPKDIVQQHAPTLVGHYERIFLAADVAGYYESRGASHPKP